MALSTLSLGMFTDRAFWITRRSEGFDSGLGPPFLTAIVISLPMRANALDILSQRANIVALRVSKMRPMAGNLDGFAPDGEPGRASARSIRRAGHPTVPNARAALGGADSSGLESPTVRSPTEESPCPSATP